MLANGKPTFAFLGPRAWNTGIHACLAAEGEGGATPQKYASNCEQTKVQGPEIIKTKQERDPRPIAPNKTQGELTSLKNEIGGGPAGLKTGARRALLRDKAKALNKIPLAELLRRGITSPLPRAL